MKVITVQRGQTLWDVALQEYGHVEGVEYILFDNPDVEPHNINKGDTLKIREEQYKDKSVALYYQTKNYTPTTNG